MTQEVSPVSGTTTSSYNEHGELVSRIDGRGVAMARTVDPLDRVTFVDYPGTDLDTNYTYDDIAVPFSKGRLTSIARPGSTVAYQYDRFGRVTQDGALGFTYDKNGNRATTTYSPTVALCTTYDFAERPATLKYTSAGGDPCLGSALVTAASYKPFGPLASLALGNGLTETRSFDARYFPDRIQVPGRLDWDYTVDAVGNVTSIADDLAPSASRSFSYNAPAPTLTDDQTTHVFYFASRPVAQWSTVSGLTYLTTDHLGTPVLATDSSGTTIWQGGFTPFGEPYQLMDPSLFLRLPGQWVDSSWSGYGEELYYNVNRWYMPGTGRYTQTDPLQSERSIRPYAYSDDNPMRFIDPLGLVDSEAQCGCCSLADIAREQQQIQNFLLANGRNYRKPWWPPRRLFSFGCGDAADSAIRDIDRTIQPKCWITRSQMLARGHVAAFGMYIYVHFVPAFRPCGSRAPQDDLFADPFNGRDELESLPTTWRADDIYCPAK
jgi:RHS repeat-associated protein